MKPARWLAAVGIDPIEIQGVFPEGFSTMKILTSVLIRPGLIRWKSGDMVLRFV